MVSRWFYNATNIQSIGLCQNNDPCKRIVCMPTAYYIPFSTPVTHHPMEWLSKFSSPSAPRPLSTAVRPNASYFLQKSINTLSIRCINPLHFPKHHLSPLSHFWNPPHPETSTRPSWIKNGIPWSRCPLTQEAESRGAAKGPMCRATPPFARLPKNSMSKKLVITLSTQCLFPDPR